MTRQTPKNHPVKFQPVALIIILALILSACAPAATPTPTQATADPAPTPTPAPTENPAITTAQLEQLIADITAELQQAAAEATDLAKIRFDVADRATEAARAFANILAAERILDPGAFTIGISPDGVAYVLLTVDSVWGKANEVALIDTGAKDPMFVTVAGAGVGEGTLKLDVSGFWAAVVDANGNLLAVVGNDKQWNADPNNAGKVINQNNSEVFKTLAEAYVLGETTYPANLNPEEQAAFETALADMTGSMTYEQQKAMIERNFKVGNTAFEALVKEDGDLEYWDGEKWNTIKAMLNSKGKIIPWGGYYDAVSEEGRSGLLKDVFADQETMDEFLRIFEIRKSNAEKKGFDSSDFNVLFVQFVPDVESFSYHYMDNQSLRFGMEGLIVIKNDQNKLVVIKISTSMASQIAVTNVNYKQTIGYSPEDLRDLKFFQNGFLGISSANLLKYMNVDLINQVKSSSLPDQEAWLEQTLSADLGNILEKIKTDPAAISEDLIDMLWLIHFN